MLSIGFVILKHQRTPRKKKLLDMPVGYNGVGTKSLMPQFPAEGRAPLLAFRFQQANPATQL